MLLPPNPFNCLLRAMLVAMLCGLLAAGPCRAATAAQEAELLLQRGDVPAALQRADDALALEPGNPALRFLRGVLLTRAARTADAADAYERMTQDFPELPEPYNNLAVLRAAAGQWDAARTLLETALRLDPQYRTANENLGDVLARLAERAYEAALGTGRSEPSLARKLSRLRELHLPAP